MTENTPNLLLVFEELKSQQRALLKSTSDAIITTDLSFCVTSWNKAAEDLYGWTAREVLGRSLVELIPTEYVHGTSAEARQALMAEGRWKGEVVQKNRDGVSVNVQACVDIIRDKEGVPTSVIAINRNRGPNARTLDEYRTYFEENVLLVFWMEFKTPIPTSLPPDEQVRMMFAEGWVRDISETLARLFGRRREEVIGAPISGFFEDHAEDPGGSRHRFHTKFVNDDYCLVSEEYGPLLTANGDEKWFLTNLKGFVVEGHLVRVWGSMSDITEARVAQAMLKESEARYRSITGNVQEGVLVIDSGQKRFFNDRYAEIFSSAPGTGSIADS